MHFDVLPWVSMFFPTAGNEPAIIALRHTVIQIKSFQNYGAFLAKGIKNNWGISSSVIESNFDHILRFYIKSNRKCLPFANEYEGFHLLKN